MKKLESNELLESRHQLVSAISVEMARSIANESKKNQGRKPGLEVEMAFAISDANRLPINSKSLVGQIWRVSARASNPYTWWWWK